MKVLQVINSLQTGGAEKLLLDTIPYYVKKGIEVDLLILNGQETPFTKKLKSTNCCQIFCLGQGSVYNPMHIFKIVPYLRKYDVLHVHLFPAQYWVVLAKLVSFSKAKLVFTEHNTTNSRISNTIYRIIDRVSYQFYDRIVCISEEIETIFINYTRLPKERFVIIENGIDLKSIQESGKIDKNLIVKSIKNNDKLLIQVSGFRAQKDQPTLIKALQYLPENVKLLLVGGGILKSDCIRLVQKLKLQERVFFLGIRTDIPQLLKSSDIVVLSSKYEGLSLASIEGMASGKPFMASEVPGLKEVVEGAGILFEQGNEKDLAHKIETLLLNHELYNEVVIDCMKRALQYDIKIMVNKHIELYKNILHAK